MEPLPEPMSIAWPFPFVPQDWEQTPVAVQAYVHTLQAELTQLRERVEAVVTRRLACSDRIIRIRYVNGRPSRWR